MKEYTGLEIAIIGMAGRFPGAGDINLFWNNLKSGIEAVSFFTDEELLQSGVDEKLINNPLYVKANALLQEKEYFDSAFFKYRPDEAKLMDPQMRIFHECVWSALEDAAVDLESKNMKAGVFAGSSGNINWELYARLMNRNSLVDDFTASLLSNPRFLATRISYILNLCGPAIYIDSACSTSLVAVNQACKSLLMGECNLAIAGGVTITEKGKVGYLYKDDMIQSRDGHSRTFDAAASGTVGGEGVGIVILKTLKNALKDGDHIWALIKGTATNNDGNYKVGYSAPSINGQAEAIKMAHKWSKVPAESISYVEAHGTGTKLGDPVEVEALNQAFGNNKEKYCALGSVKTNIGHLDAAAGIAGLIKTVLSLKHRQIPPSLNFSKANEAINFKNGPFYVNTKLTEWKNDKYPLRAGLSSFGIGGTNAHVILEEAPDTTKTSTGREYKVLVLSGKTVGALERNKQNLMTFLKENEDINLADVAHTLQRGRCAFKYRSAIVCRNTGEAIAQLAYSQVNNNKTIIEAATSPMLVFMFPGQGSQYLGMCKELYGKEACFREEADKCFEIIKKKYNRDIREVIFGQDDKNIDNTINTQPALFVMEYALARCLISWGINPGLMIGHSIGEYVAACISDVFSLDDALSLVVKRGELMQGVSEGKMLAISITEELLMPLLKGRDDISLAAVNSSELCVVAGKKESIDDFKETLKRERYVCNNVRTSHAFHSFMMDEILEKFGNEVENVKLNPPQIPFVSNLSGIPVTENEVLEKSYWVNHLRNTVKFSKGVETILQHQQVIFVEVGPGKVLSSLVRSNKKIDKGHLVINLLGKGIGQVDELHQLASGIGQLWTHGIIPKWQNYYQQEIRQKISLPTYSFEKTKYPVYVDAMEIIAGVSSGNLPDSKAGLLFNPVEPETIRIEVDEEKLPMEHSTNATSVEQTVASIWQNFFGDSTISRDDDFFETGGDSLQALTITGRMFKAFGVQVPVKVFFEHASIRKLSAYIRSVKFKAAEPNQVTQYSPIPLAEKRTYYPLSSAQKRLYFLYQLDETSLAYNLPYMIWLNGDLNRKKIDHAFSILLDRHGSLRMSFDFIDGIPVQRPDERTEFAVQYFETHENEIAGLIGGFIRPFNLNKGALLRAGIITVGHGKNLFIIDMHHIVADGVSTGILVNELIKIYNNEELEEVNLQYTDYVSWMQMPEQQTAILMQKNFWLNEFADRPDILDMPTDFQRPLVKTYDGNLISFTIGGADARGLRSVAVKEGATMFMTIFSIYNILLSKLTNQEDIVIGTPIAGRGRVELEKMIGMFVNTLPFRNFPKGDLSFCKFLRDVRMKVLAIFEHPLYPYEELIDDLKVERNTAHNPLFDVMFSYIAQDAAELNMPGFSVASFQNEQVFSQFDLTLTVFDTGEEINMDFKYPTSLFKKETILRYVNYFKKIIHTVIACPDIRLADISIITDEEQRLIVNSFNDTALAYPQDNTVVTCFEEKVLTCGEAPAILFEGNTITYNEVNVKSNQLAWAISKRGLKKESIVGILLSRSPQMIIAMFAILKAGCAYTPIDPEYPVDRIKYIVDDSELSLIITESSQSHIYGCFDENIKLLDLTAESFFVGNKQNPGLDLSSVNLAYLIYTSGSTGNPKGVMITHRNVVNLVAGVTQRILATKYASILCLTTISFDIFVLETILPILSGIRVVLTSDAEQKDPTAIAKLICQQRVDLLQITPSHLKLLFDISEKTELLKDVKVLMVGGEALPGELLTELKQIYKGRIYNMYGPTETTVWSAIKDLTNAASVTIGDPIANTTIRILNRYNNIQPIGVPGELCIGGDGVMRGYWKQDELTLEKLVADPATKNASVYRTGDLVKWLPDGSIVFLGRTDYQVKLRGFRIELGEIESCLSAYNDIHQAIVVKKEKKGEEFLVGYYVTNTEVSVLDLREHLAGRLPEYMIPAYFVRLEKIPLTPNGKIDRKSLPDPQKFDSIEHLSPNDEWEVEVLSMWKEVLEMEKISTDVDFFLSGGNSLKLVALFKLLDEHYPKHIKVMDLFSNRTIAGMARIIKDRKGAGINANKKKASIINI